jgi:hypothetical protein
LNIIRSLLSFKNKIYEKIIKTISLAPYKDYYFILLKLNKYKFYAKMSIKIIKNKCENKIWE